MAAAVCHFETETQIDLLAGLQLVEHALAFFDLAAASVGIQAIDRINQVAVVSHQPIHSVEAASFFISREGNDDIPVRLKTLLLHANEVGYQESVSGLDVVGAAAVKIPVQLGEFKGIESPVLASCLNYVQVREQQNGLAHAGPAQARDQVSLARIRAQHLHVCGGEPDRLEPRRHCLGGRRGAADGIRRVDFNQFFENIASQLLLGRTGGGLLA